MFRRIDPPTINKNYKNNCLDGQVTVKSNVIVSRKKKGKKYWTEEASHGADILPAVLNVADLAFRRLWKFDSHHRSSQLYVRLFLFSPYNLCPSLSLAKIKKKKEEENNKRAARELSVDTGFLPIRSLPCYVALPLTRKRTWLLERRVSVCSHPSSNSQAAQ